MILLFCVLSYEAHDVLDMRSMGEHVDRLHLDDVIVLRKDRKVARLGRRVAADIHHAVGRRLHEHLRNVGMDAGPRRVEHHDVGMAVHCDELRAEHVLHVAGEELRVLDAVDPCVDLCVFDGLGNVFDAHDLRGEG